VSIRLHSGAWEAELRPEIGGALAALRWRGRDVLRPMPAGATSPLDSACFPLVPYCNRIRDGAFAWLGDEVQLPANFPPEPHSLHGFGWEQPWRVESQAEFKCALVHEHAGLGPRPWKRALTAWPWAYRAEQRVRLGPKGCAITLDLSNRSNVPMPAGLGLHPYFPRGPETRVQFAANGMVAVGPDLIPTGEFAADDLLADWEEGTPLPPQTVDHCFLLWGGRASIADDRGTISLAARGAPMLHVFAPADGGALCLEPVSHMPDALNQDPAGMIALPPGCTASLQLWISAE